MPLDTGCLTGCLLKHISTWVFAVGGYVAKMEFTNDSLWFLSRTTTEALQSDMNVSVTRLGYFVKTRFLNRSGERQGQDGEDEGVVERRTEEKFH